MRTSINLAAICLAATVAAAPASAAVVTFNGDTSNGPAFSRPTSGGGSVSANSNSIYQPISFTVSSSGQYTFDLASGYDAFLALYSAPFNPASPLANLIGANDDSGGSLNAQLTASLLTGTTYVAVATSFYNSAAGAFTLTATGPGTASFGSVAAAVPEPATWAMMLVGFGAMGVAFRRRRALTATARFANA